MEAFTLLKYWRPSGRGDTALLTGVTTSRNNTITTASDEPYFDLEFTPPTEDDTGEAAGGSLEIDDETSSVNTETESGSSAADELPDHETDDEEEEEEELKFAVKSDENNVIISPSSIIAEDNSRLPASLLKSATKFRVLLLKLKKTKSSNKSDGKTGSDNQFIEFDVDEVKGPLISLFARDNTTGANNTLLHDSDAKCAASNDERSNLTKEMVHKYLKMLKPIRVPGRFAEKMKFSVTGGSSSSNATTGVSPPELRRSNVVNVHKSRHQNKQAGNINTRRNHLGKSRSSSGMVVASPPGGMGSNRRRDDSLLQQEDGIRGAILHCKRSFNASRDGESAMLSRSVSDPSYNI